MIWAVWVAQHRFLKRLPALIKAGDRGEDGYNAPATMERINFLKISSLLHWHCVVLVVVLVAVVCKNKLNC